MILLHVFSLLLAPNIVLLHVSSLLLAAARHVMCEAYKLGMTQREGYVWFLPGWFKENWFDTDVLRWVRGQQRYQRHHLVRREGHTGIDQNKVSGQRGRQG